MIFFRRCLNFHSDSFCWTSMLLLPIFWPHTCSWTNLRPNLRSQVKKTRDKNGLIPITIIHLHPDQDYVLIDSLVVQTDGYKIPLKCTFASRPISRLYFNPPAFIWHHLSQFSFILPLNSPFQFISLCMENPICWSAIFF